MLCSPAQSKTKLYPITCSSNPFKNEISGNDASLSSVLIQVSFDSLDNFGETDMQDQVAYPEESPLRKL